MVSDRNSHRNSKVDKNNKNLFRQKLSNLLELPKEVVLDLSKIMIVGNRNVLVENYKGIIEYENTKIRINTTSGIIAFEGKGLFIKEITSEDIMVEGEIKNIEFVR